MDATPGESSARRVSASHRHRTRVDRLRDAWYSTSDRTSWPRPGDWWQPAVDAMLRAIVRGKDVREPCARLGQARAEAGLSLGQTIDDLAALYRHLPEASPPSWLVRILVDAWARPQPSHSRRSRA
jgi:hypothetical protein